MNKLKPGFQSSISGFSNVMKTYASNAVLFLVFLLLATVYEIFLNAGSNKEDLPLFTISTSLILNSLLYWIKLYLLLLIPYWLLS